MNIIRKVFGKGGNATRIREPKRPVRSQTDARKSGSGDTDAWPKGKRIGNDYEILDVAGGGAMGIVYLARDRATQREIAIKAPRGALLEDPIALGRFAAEAEAWTELIHPNIVCAFDVLDDQSTDYKPVILMDYCDGGTVADRLSESGYKVPLADALEIGIQICWAMDFAHAHGRIHRDIKPANILFSADGRALLTDFGLVKSVKSNEASPHEADSPDDAATLSGGTPAYAAPEQWIGRATHASDFYSFGVLLYELCCGRVPFSGSSPDNLIAQHMSDEPPSPASICNDLPEDLNDLILTCLAKQPEQRPTDWSALENRLSASFGIVTGSKESELALRKPTQRDIGDSDLTARSWALIRLCNGMIRRCEFREAKEYLEIAENNFEELRNGYGIAASYLQLASISIRRGKYADAIDVYERALGVYQGLGATRGIATTLANIATALASTGGQERAIHYSERALEAFELSGDEQGACACRLLLATFAQTRGEFESALDIYTENLALARDNNDIISAAQCLSNMAGLAHTQANYDEAEGLFRESLECYEHAGCQSEIANTYHNLGEVSRERRGFDKAIKYYRKSLSIYEATEDPVGIARYCNSVGILAKNRSAYHQAAELYEKCLDLCAKTGDVPQLAKCYANMGVLADAQSEHHRALDLYRRSLALSKELGDVPAQVRCYENMAAAAADLGDSSMRSSYLSEAHAARALINENVNHEANHLN